MSTKREIINLALAEIGLGPSSYSAQPEDLQDAATHLDAIAALWAREGVGLAYPFGGSDLDADAGLPAYLVQGISAELAKAIAPGYGKQVSRETLSKARRGWRLAERLSATYTQPQRLPDALSVPAGAGWKQRRRFTLADVDDGAITNRDIDR